MSKYGKITLDGLKALDASGIPAAATMVGELCRHAFALVADKSDWKAPVDKVLHVATLDYDYDALAYAVEFMTGTKPTLTESEGGTYVRVTADGYRKGPCGDH